MLTAKDETFDKVLGLELGADDYMTKPFDPKELMARIKAVHAPLRRPPSHPSRKELAFPDLVINIEHRTLVTYNGKDIEMPPKEIELLYFLASTSRQGLHPRSAAGTGLGLRLLRRFAHGGRSHQAHPRKAARLRGIRLADQDGLERWI